MNMKNVSKWSIRLSAIVIVMTMFMSIFAPMQTVYAAETYYYNDGDSSNRIEDLYNYIDYDDGSYQGMIFTDKTVKIDAMEPKTIFTASSIAKKTVGKSRGDNVSDTVIILDISREMLVSVQDVENKTDRVTRFKIQSEIEAANDAMNKILAANENNRVAVVAYGGKKLSAITAFSEYEPATVLLPLDHYSNVTINETSTKKDFISIEMLDPARKETVDLVNDPMGIIKVEARSTTQSTTVTGKAYLGGKANLQYGLYKGMNQLVNAEVLGPFKPNVLLFMGAVPTESCGNPEWWEPTVEQENIQYVIDGQEKETNVAHIVKSIMMATYKKQEIEQNYEIEPQFSVVQIFSDLAAPANNGAKAFTDSTTWGSDVKFGEQKVSISTIFDDYVANKPVELVFGRQNNENAGTYTLEKHPQNDITKEEILNYIDSGFYFKTIGFEQKKILEGISNIIDSNISEIKAPMDPGSFITYTDPIGEYNEIKGNIDLKFYFSGGSAQTIQFRSEEQPDGSVLYRKLPNHSIGGTTRHSVYGTLYDDELNKIEIKVVDADGKKTLTAKIPATLVPMSTTIFTYNLDGTLAKTDRIEEGARVELSYKTRLRSGLVNGDSKIIGEVSPDYLAQNVTENGKGVYFYTTYKGENAKAEFTPSGKNLYYCDADGNLLADEIRAHSIKKDNSIARPSNAIIGDYVSKFDVKGNSVVNEMGNVGILGFKKPDAFPKDLTLTYDLPIEDQGKSEYIKGDTTTNFELTFKSNKTDGPLEVKITSKDGTERTETLTVSGKKTNVNLKLGEKLYLSGEAFSKSDYVKVKSTAVPSFFDSIPEKKVNLVDGPNATEINPQIVLNKTKTDIPFKVKMDGVGQSSLNFITSADAGTSVDPITQVNSGAAGEVTNITAKAINQLGTASVYIRQSKFQPGIKYDEGMLKVNLTTEIDSDGKYVTTITDYEKGTLENGVWQFVAIEDTTAAAFTNNVDTTVGTKAMVLGKLSLTKGVASVTSDKLEVIYDKPMNPGEYKNQIQFIIEPVGEAPAFEVPTVTVDARGIFSMVSPFLEEGKYTYKIKPVPTTGIVYDADSTEKEITITIGGDGKATLNGVDNLEFKASYKPEGKIKLNYINSIAGRKFLGLDKETITFSPTSMTYNGLGKINVNEEQKLNTTKGEYSVTKSKEIPVAIAGDYVFSTSTGGVDKLTNVVNYNAGDKKLVVKVVDNMDGTLTTTEPNNFELNMSYRPGAKTFDGIKIQVNATNFNLNDTLFKYKVTPVGTTPDSVYNKPVSVISVDDLTAAKVLKFHFSNEEIIDQLAKDNNLEDGYEAVFSYQISEVSDDLSGNILKYGHDKSVYQIDVKFKIDPKYGKANSEMTITKIKDSKGNTLSSPELVYPKGNPETDPKTMNFTHSVTISPASARDNAGLTLKAELDNRDGKPLEAGEVELRADSLLNIDSGIDITKENPNVKIEKDGKHITAAEFVNTFSIKNNEDGFFNLDGYNFIFKEPGVYKLRLKKVAPQNGVENDNAQEKTLEYRTLKYVVTHLSYGVLNVKVTTDADATSSVFRYRYRPTPQSLNVVVKEEIEGRPWIDGDNFEFTCNGEKPVSITKDTEGHRTSITTKEFDEGGKEFAFNLTHNSDIVAISQASEEEAKQVIVSSKDNLDGTITLTAKLQDGTPIEIKQSSTDPASSEMEIVFKSKYNIINGENKNLVSLAEDFKGRKNNEWLENDVFNFTIEAGDDTTKAAVENKEIILTNNAASIKHDTPNHELTFGDFTFTKAGTYKFNISQKNPEMAGVSNNEAKQITIEVTDDLKGNLIASVKEGKQTFENIYAAEAVTVDGAKDLTVEKQLTGRKDNGWLDKDVFNFTIEAGDDTTKAAVENKEVILENNQITITNKSADHKAAFGNITFNKVGEYNFVVKETKGSISGIAYDESVKNVKVTVTDNQEGKLVATVEADALIFNNTYSITDVFDGNIAFNAGTLTVQGSKGTEVKLQKDQFTFKLTAKENYPTDAIVLPENLVVKNAEDGSITFGQMTIKKPGVYTFEVQQDTTNVNPGWVYDTSIKEVTFTATDNNNKGLDVIVEGLKNQYFVNEYAPEDAAFEGPTVAKNLLGRNWKDTDIFEFVIETEKDYGNKLTLPNETTISISGKDEIKEASFGDITFNHTGTYTLMISEKDNAISGIIYDQNVKLITVDIKDDGNGSLVATSQAEEKSPYQFTNNYVPDGTIIDGSTNLSFTSTVEGRQWMDGETFTFTLTPITANAPMPKNAVVTVSKPENGNTATFSFENITFKNVGMEDAEYTPDGVKFKKFEYTLEQTVNEADNGMTYDTASRKIEITVFDKGEGSYSATVKINGNKEFINIYRSSLVFDDLQIEKTMIGKDMAKDQFSFIIKALDNESATKIGKSDISDVLRVNSPSAVNGETVTMLPFTGIKFTQADAGKTFTYEISEEHSADIQDSIHYDLSVYKVEIAVSDDLKGNLTTVTTISKDGQNIASVENGKPAVVSFVNTYYAEGTLGGEAETKILAENILTGKEQNAGDFNFQIKDNNGNVVATASNPAAGDGIPAQLEFSAINYNSDQAEKDVKAGIAQKNSDGTYVYSYSVEELTTAGNIPEGVTPINAEYQITVKVKDTGNGTYDISVTYPENQDHLTFENNFNAESVIYNVNGSMKLVVPEGSRLTIEDLAGKYTYNIYDMNNDAEASIPMPEKITTTNDAAGNINFGKITYTKDLLDNVQADENGVRSIKYQYRITQSGDVNGVVDEKEVDSFTIELKDEGKGYMIVNLIREGENEPSTSNKEFEFTNTYKIKEQEVSLSASGYYTVNKELSGRELVQGEFTFEMKDKDNNVVATGVNNADGSIELSDITIKQPGTYSYVVYEVNGGKTLNGVTYDSTKVEINVVATDNKDGTMSIEWNAPTTETITFKNSYVAEPTAVSLSANKHLAGRELEQGEFSFVLKDENGNTLQVKKNDKQGAVQFDEITYNEEGTWNYTIEEIKGTDAHITYDDKVYHVTVKVTDDLMGHLIAEVVVDENEVVFHNVYTKDIGPDNPDPDKPGPEPEKPDPEEKPEPEKPGPDEKPEVDTPDKDDVATTSDESNVMLWAAASLVSLSAATILVWLKKRYSKE